MILFDVLTAFYGQHWALLLWHKHSSPCKEWLRAQPLETGTRV